MIEVCAEIGVNHQGSIETACKLVDAAIGAGADTVKTQLWNTERVYPRERWAEMKKLELSRYDIMQLKQYCDIKGIELIVTPDEIEDAQYLKQIGVKRIKTSSQDITNLLFLKAVESLGLPMIVSTGACTWHEMDKAIATLTAARRRLTVLHCVSAYPAPIDEINLLALKKIPDFVAKGLSDHTSGYTAALVALGLGATMFEKHLTLDSTMPGPDHAASLQPPEMKFYINSLRLGSTALGDGIKRIMPCEVENRKRYEEFIAPRKETA